MYRVTKEFSFSAAHRLLNHKGSCKNLHGHNYKVFVTLSKNAVDCVSGMVIDFKEMKEHVGYIIDKYYDHALILNTEDPIIALVNAGTIKTKIFIIKGEPTAEIMAHSIYTEITIILNALDNILPIMVDKVVIYETETSHAEYTELV